MDKAKNTLIVQGDMGLIFSDHFAPHPQSGLIHLTLSDVIQTEHPFQKLFLVFVKFIVEVVHLTFSISGIHLKVGLIFRNLSIIFLMSAHGDRFVDKATEFIEVILIQCLCSIIHCLVKLGFNDLDLMKFIGMYFNDPLFGTSIKN